MRRTGLFIFLAAAVALSAGCVGQADAPGIRNVYNQSISGIFAESQVWSGEILVTGDVLVLGDLNIMPGTAVRFAVQDDQQDGYETPADGYNDLDPTRLPSYGKNHSSLTVRGVLSVSGTPDKRIIFTSAAENPRIADWEAIYPQGDGSIIEYAIIEWSRNGISPGDEPSLNSMFRNNLIRYTMWGAVSLGWSGAQAYNNEIHECGHEGVDVQGRNPVIINNTVRDCHAGIVVLRGAAIVKDNMITDVGAGIHVGRDATPVMENNHIELAPSDSEKEWRYGNFAYPMFGDPAGTPVLTEVYMESGMPRYAVPAYRIEEKDYFIKVPQEAEEAEEWLFYGWKDDRWQEIEAELISGELRLPSGYSTYVIIPEPAQEEKDADRFNEQHADIYRIMAV